MNQFKKLIFYILVMGGFTLLILFVINKGAALESERNIFQVSPSGWKIRDAITGNITHPLAVLLLQIVTIILVARLFGWLCRKINQPAVIGEIAAGIILGPSLLGMFFPEIFSVLFPSVSINNLQFISQIGLILFMFVVGMELDVTVLKDKAREAIIISHASIVIPFTLGIGLAYFLYSSYAPEGVPFVSFALFIGISMSITAFPVLARIVQEKGIHKTKLGNIAITCAAVDDITAWSLLAMVIAIVNAGTLASSLVTIILAIIYVFIALKLVKPFLKRIGELHATKQNLHKSQIAIFFVVLIGSAYITEIIGIHALFGAFMAGVIMPDNQKFKQLLIEKIEDIALVLLLPLFFVYTGLRTQIGLLNDSGLWLVFGSVIFVAVLGKFGGSAAAAKFVGQSWKDSLTLGALMNTRGLVELVALNIGYDLGVLNPEIFTMLVLMALITTVMTAPSLSIIEKVFKSKRIQPQQTTEKQFRVLISFGNPEMGRVLFKMMHKFGNSQDYLKITALHLFVGNLFSKYKLDDAEKESFGPILNEARKTGLPVQKIFKISENITSDIIEETKNKYDLLLIGIGQSIYEGSVLGRVFGTLTKVFDPSWMSKRSSPGISGSDYLDERTDNIMMKVKIPSGILVNRNISDLKNLLVVIIPGDNLFLKFIFDLIRNHEINITIAGIDLTNTEQMFQAISNMKNISYAGPELINDNSQLFDLTILSVRGWQKLHNKSSISKKSVLILKV